MDNLEHLFKDVSALKKKYDEISKITGGNFNIFKTLNMQTNEVKLHSALIAELLNVKGTHGQGAKYLKEFIAVLCKSNLTQDDVFKKIENFDYMMSECTLEHYISEITENQDCGGRIDILLKDKNNQRIIIENKIYATDQAKQLKRYHNFDKDAVLLYLNLDGSNPNPKSLDGLIEKGFSIISYKEHILNWLDACLKESVLLSTIRETISQYIALIKNLTGQPMNNDMQQNIKTLLLLDKDYFSSVDEIKSAYDAIINKTKADFFNIIEKNIEKSDHKFSIKIPDSYTDLYIQLFFGEDAGGFYFAYRISDKESWKRDDKGVIERIKTINNENELFLKYSSIIKELLPESKSTGWSLAWYNPSDFKGNKKLHQIDFETFKSFQNEKELESYVVDKLLTENETHFNKIEARISNI